MFRKKKDGEKDDVPSGEPGVPGGRPRRHYNSGPFDDFFADFSRMEEIMNDLMKGMFSGGSGFGDIDIGAGKPVVYGFSMKTGPDGKPVIREFGNVKPRGKPVVSDAREPLVDVMDRGSEIIVIAELPGVSKKEIELNADPETLTIRVDGAKKYYKEVRMPREVKEGETDATYKNGILEVKLKPKEERKGGGKKIEIK